MEKSKVQNFEEDIKSACKYFVAGHKDSYDSRLLNLVEKISYKKELILWFYLIILHGKHFAFY